VITGKGIGESEEKEEERKKGKEEERGGKQSSCGQISPFSCLNKGV
jgi:hypothetical protein